MHRQSRKKTSNSPRVADQIMAGMQELVNPMDHGKTPREMFTVRTLEIPEPRIHRAAEIRRLRGMLSVSQAVFALLLGVSLILVKSWERGVREPNLLARRLLDTIRADPARWLATIQRTDTKSAA